MGSGSKETASGGGMRPMTRSPSRRRYPGFLTCPPTLMSPLRISAVAREREAVRKAGGDQRVHTLAGIIFVNKDCKSLASGISEGGCQEAKKGLNF